MKPTLVIRADADSTIGVGHVMRCLALAQAWQDEGGNATFACVRLPDNLAQRLRSEGCEVGMLTRVIGSEDDAAATLDIARKLGADWLAVDGYSFPTGYLAALRAAGRPVLALDDMSHLDQYPVDLLLNQNLSAEPGLYAGKLDAGTELLLGPQFGLLRREFRTAAATPRASAEGFRRALISFGGADAENLSSAVLARLAESSPPLTEVVVLAGPANPHVGMLRHQARGLPFLCRVEVDVRDVAALMAWADVAIGAAGSTVWELASLRVPALLGAFEANQEAGAGALRRVPFFRVLPGRALLQCNFAAELAALAAQPRSQAGEFSLDASGASRVVQAMHRIHAAVAK